MSSPETMAAFLATQIDFVLFFCGLAFVLLGAVSFAVATVWGGENSWRLLGLFGLVHGASVWLDLIAVIVVDTPIFVAARIVVLAGSFLLLMAFARRKANHAGPVGPAICLVIMAFIVAGGMVGGMAVAGALTRYTIGFLSAAATSWVFFVQARTSSGALGRLGMVAAAGFALYAIATGLIVPDAPIWPASELNQTSFFQATGVPIQLIRGLLACSLALSVWAIWGRLLIAEVSLESYRDHLRRQFVWTVAALTTILLFGWMLTQFLGEVYARNVVESTQGDINLLASRLSVETAMADGMVRNIAGSPSVLPLLSSGSARSDRRARSVLDLGVDTSAAKFGAILDASGTVMASSGQDDGRDAATWRTAPWFQKSLAGQAGSEFSYDRADRARYYYASYP
ncbi:MAG: GGDEF domain-containing protein, partial [Bradyrhizobium sp.]|nr:GGDEF domain-containing protein [Bradyrhizobium sp.]